MQETRARRIHEDMNDTEYRMNSDLVKKLEADKKLVRYCCNLRAGGEELMIILYTLPCLLPLAPLPSSRLLFIYIHRTLRRPRIVEKRSLDHAENEQ